MAGRDERAAWLQDPNAACTPVTRPVRPYRLVLLGAPGIGKGTQAALLSERLGPCHLSTGDVFRSARGLDPCVRTPALNAAVEAMNRGLLVSDETVLQIVSERVACLKCEGGFLLDGFPRTLAQAHALDALFDREGIALDAVISYELPIERIVARLAGRRVCPACKTIYHLQAHPPARAGYCDACNGPLVQREDDQPQAVRVRMQTYLESTAPLANHYAARGLLRVVSADGTPDEIYQRTLALVGAAPVTA
jgi:adenylate kinase